jgi:5,6-dimethylbenzimidazole synthase
MINRQFTLQEQQTLQDILQARRDVRGNRFSSKTVEESKIDKILEAASWAPSVGFSQPWEFIIVEDKAIRSKIVTSFEQVTAKAKEQFSDEKQALYAKLKLEGIKEAPVNIAVFYRPSKLPVLGQSSMQETGKYSVVCAIQNMWLMARAMNIGLGWVSILEPQAVKKILNAPEDAELVGYLCLGYVKEFLDQPELERLKWEKRKPIESTVFKDNY